MAARIEHVHSLPDAMPIANCLYAILLKYILGIIRICIICLILSSMWRVQSGEMPKCGRDSAVLSSAYPVHGAVSEVLLAPAFVILPACTEDLHITVLDLLHQRLMNHTARTSLAIVRKYFFDKIHPCLTVRLWFAASFHEILLAHMKVIDR